MQTKWISIRACNSAGILIAVYLTACATGPSYYAISDEAYQNALAAYRQVPDHKSIWFFELGTSSGDVFDPNKPKPKTGYTWAHGAPTKDAAILAGKDKCEQEIQVGTQKFLLPLATPCTLIYVDGERIYDVTPKLLSTIQGRLDRRASDNSAENAAMVAATVAALSAAKGNTQLSPTPPSAVVTPLQSSNVASANRDKSHLRVDNCLKFEVKSNPSMYGDATVTNACNFTIQYSFCYQGGTGKLFDCGGTPRDRGSDSLGPGRKQDLPEYKRDRNTGLTAVACRGAVGEVLPLISNSGRPPGCY